MTGRPATQRSTWATRAAVAPFLDVVIASVDRLEAVACVVGRCDGRTDWIDSQTVDLLGVQAGRCLWEFVEAEAQPVLRGLLADRCGAERLSLALVGGDGRAWPIAAMLAIAGDRFLLIGEHEPSRATDGDLEALLDAAQAEERRRVEQDIHDSAQQRLLALALELELEADAAGDRALSARLSGLRDRVDDALRELREVIHSPHPRTLAASGLAAALRDATRASPVPVAVAARRLVRYAPDTERIVYFACLEAVQNAIKHARAHAVSIDLEERDGAVRFRVRDDGCGFVHSAEVEHGGLAAMRERIRAAGGSLRIVSALGRGTTLAGSVPLGDRAARAAS